MLAKRRRAKGKTGFRLLIVWLAVLLVPFLVFAVFQQTRPGSWAVFRGTAAEPLAQASVYVDEAVTAALAEPASPGSRTTTEVLIYLQRPVVRQKVSGGDKNTRRKERRLFVNELKQGTDLLRGRILSVLDPSIRNGHIKIRKQYFIDNILLALIDADGVRVLSETPGVLRVLPNGKIKLPPQATSVTTMTWNIPKIAADRVWSEMGITGEGVVVANIDSGVQWDHPALKNAYRGWNSAIADHNYNWFDPNGLSPLMPLDNNGHGTHTMGTMVGFDGTMHIGVAPGAKWIAVLGCPGGFCDNSILIEAGQWVLAPTRLDGTGADPAKAPDIVNNSWGGDGCNPFYQGVIESWRNAGIVPVFSAGNKGPNGYTVGSPGDYPLSISVGAVSSGDIAADFSGRGPACALFDSVTKPDISAPGVDIYSSIPYDGYLSKNGTSMAAPHAAGVVALLLQYRPNLTAYEIEQILKRSATDLGTPGADNTYGAGLINAYRAMQIDPATILNSQLNCTT